MRTPATAESRLRVRFQGSVITSYQPDVVSHLVRLDLRCASKLTERFSRKHNTLSEGLVQDPSEMMFCRFAADCATQHRYLARSASARRPPRSAPARPRSCDHHVAAGAHLRAAAL